MKTLTRKPGRRRTNEGLAEVAAKVLEEVAALSRPLVSARVILTGYTMHDSWYVARLRSIAAARIAALGFRTCHIARLFKQGWVTTHNQIQTAPRLAGRPMFRHYFQSTPDGPVRVDCGSGNDYGICPQCKRGHGYQVQLETATP
jgi:hypothetical protein